MILRIEWEYNGTNLMRKIWLWISQGLSRIYSLISENPMRILILLFICPTKNLVMCQNRNLISSQKYKQN